MAEISGRETSVGKMKKIYSFYDNRGMLAVDCTECTRGYNGDKSCAAGAKYRRGVVGLCFCGTLKEEIAVILRKKEMEKKKI